MSEPLRNKPSTPAELGSALKRNLARRKEAARNREEQEESQKAREA